MIHPISFDFDVQSIVEDGESTTTNNTTYQDKATLTFTPKFSGTYKISFSCEVKATGTGWVAVQGFDTTHPTINQCCYSLLDDDYYHMESAFREIELTKGVSKTFKIQFYRDSIFGTAYIRRARIIAEYKP